ncbi:hypothetical protein FocTR4_00004345 [Fusarium oxysporum f. sp. cubense]|uniref:Uncharacterized protein n=1 Tax=Fusarium oxysporum f. sp. cubense TaxID=61366 RepID=A0A5C6TEY2_FUSOC|nr:hypothetical protein FocTR4_00004345 [Fusarium oxysporum f. sp. cubense]
MVRAEPGGVLFVIDPPRAPKSIFSRKMAIILKLYTSKMAIISQSMRARAIFRWPLRSRQMLMISEDPSVRYLLMMRARISTRWAFLCFRISRSL